MSEVLSIGHSPDPDDAFMFCALSNGTVKIRDYEIDHVLQDIQTLNERATKGELAVTAISAHAYWSVADKYWIMATGASMEATIRAIEQRGQREVVVAVPVSAQQTLRRIAHLADAAIAVVQPESLLSVGQWYDDFSQLSDPEVR